MWPHLKAWLSRPENRTPLLVGGSTRVLIFFIAFIGIRFVGDQSPDAFLYHGGQPHPVKLLDNFQRFDSYWFLNIARNGYRYFGVQEQMDRKRRVAREDETNITPFPLYPMGIWLLNLAVGDRTLSGMLLSLGCFLGALMVFYRMVRDDFGHGVAGRAVLYISIYPTAWLYNALYSESLFLLLTLLCLWRARKGNALEAGLFGMGAAATRLAGSLMVVPVVAEFLLGDKRQPHWHKTSPALLAGALTCMGWVGYFIYLRGLTGKLLIYFVAQRGWHKGFAMPWTALWNLLAPGLFRSAMRVVQLAFLLLFTPLTVLGLQRLRPSYALLLLLGFLMPLCVTNMLGLPRYFMVLYPAFILLAQAGEDRRVHTAVTVGFPLLMGMMMMPWLMWLHSY